MADAPKAKKYRRPDGSTYTQAFGAKSAQDVEVPDESPSPAPKAADQAKSIAATPSPQAKSSADVQGEKEAPYGTTFEGQQSAKRAASKAATDVASGQEREASQGDYGGLSMGERGSAERMVRSGEAKDAKDAADKIKAKRPKPTPTPTPSAADQAKAISQ